MIIQTIQKNQIADFSLLVAHHKNLVVHKNGKVNGFGKKKLIRAILLCAIVRYTLSRYAVRNCTIGTSAKVW